MHPKNGYKRWFAKATVKFAHATYQRNYCLLQLYLVLIRYQEVKHTHTSAFKAGQYKFFVAAQESSKKHQAKSRVNIMNTTSQRQAKSPSGLHCHYWSSLALLHGLLTDLTTVGHRADSWVKYENSWHISWRYRVGFERCALFQSMEYIYIYILTVDRPFPRLSFFAEG